MSTRSIILLAVLVAIFAEFPLSSCFQWIPSNQNVETKLTLPTRTSKKSVELTWEWNLGSGETTNQAEIKRYKTNNKDATVTVIAVLFSDNKASISNEFKSFYTINAQVGTAGGNNGFMKLTITEVSNQGNNKDGTPVNLMDANYTYECGVTIRDVSNQPVSKSRTNTLIVLVRPTITTVPKDELVSNKRNDLTLTCMADGKPPPTISWERVSQFAGKSDFQGNNLVISKSTGDDEFQNSDIGTYNCTATNEGGSVSATAIVQYTECSTGCAIDDKIAIEMTDLTYGSAYENERSDEYTKLKKAIETECFTVYSNAVDQQVYSCIVTQFRKGSVIANLKITYPDVTKEPRKPLEDAIKTGTFAGQKVRTSFVSPTSAPTQPTQPSNSPTETPTDPSGPDSGQRADSEGGLSKEAITAIVVVFSIIFVVIIVVLVVCMLKRRKSSGGKSRPPPAHTQAAPLKSQPVRDPLYDDEPDDRYNGGGPPPQYTAANYAEVRPTHAEQNESQMEWDKSVKDENEMWI